MEGRIGGQCLSKTGGRYSTLNDVCLFVCLVLEPHPLATKSQLNIQPEILLPLILSMERDSHLIRVLRRSLAILSWAQLNCVSALAAFF